MLNDTTPSTPQKGDLQGKALTLEDIFNNSDLKQLFKTYCDMEHSVENFLFLEQLEKFKSTKNEEKRLSLARAIYSDFIDIDSKNQLNLNSELIDAVKKDLAQPIPGLDPPCPTTLFDNIEKTVDFIMQDTMMRFVKIEEIKNHIPNETKGVPILFRRNTNSPMVEHQVNSPRKRGGSTRDDFQKAIEDYKMSQQGVTKTHKSSPLLSFMSVSESEQELTPMQMRKLRKQQQEKKIDENPLTKKSSDSPSTFLNSERKLKF